MVQAFDLDDEVMDRCYYPGGHLWLILTTKFDVDGAPDRLMLIADLTDVDSWSQ